MTCGGRPKLSEKDVNLWKTELIANGFRPQRYGVAVRIVRRLLWPFVRPFHFYALEEMGRISDQHRLLDDSRCHAEADLRAANERISSNVSALSDRLAEVVDRQDAIMAAVERMVSSQSLLRTEVAAAVHRHTVIESEVAELTSNLSVSAKRLQQIDDRVQQDTARVVNMTGRLQQTEDRIREGTARLGAVADRLGQVDHRTKLFLTHGPLGLILLKEGEYISDTVARTGVHDQHIVELMDTVAARRQGCAIDVGAHFGLLTLAMARRFQRVICFEPNSFNFSILAANVVLNRLDNVKCINSALYSEAVSLSLGRASQQEISLPLDTSGRFDGFASQNLGAFMFTENGSGIFPTEAKTLDSLGLDDVSFLKIDVQGADGEVIQGARETIRRCKPVIVFEWEALLAREFSVSLEDVIGMLTDANYTVDILKVHNEKQTDHVAWPRDSIGC